MLTTRMDLVHDQLDNQVYLEFREEVQAADRNLGISVADC